MSSLLRLVHVRKRFGGVVALAGVDFDLAAGEVHALCGENGAGKSTLIKILSGIHRGGSFEGEYLIDGAPVQFGSYADAARAGLAVIYQELALCEDLTVAENIFLGQELLRPAGLVRDRLEMLLPALKALRFIDHARMEREAHELLSAFGIDLDPRARVRRLGVGQKQLVEIAKALARKSRILVLDEPTAALSGRESDVLLALLRSLRARGTTCIYISHKLDEVFAIADRVTVLRDGRSVLCQATQTLQPTDVVSAMCGRAIEDLFPTRPPRLAKLDGTPLLAVRDLSFAQRRAGAPRLQALTFTVGRGEVVGISGLLGAGRSELLRHLYGAWGVRTAGEVLLDGVPFTPAAPTESLAQGVALLSEERRRDGLCMDESVSFNLSLSSLRALQRGGLIDGRRERARNLQMADSVRVRSAAGGVSDALLALRARALSGGNQQKVVLGKALLTSPRLLLLDEPTRGVDIGAKQDLYELIASLCQQGLGVLLVSSELPELIGLCDRVLVLSDGTLRAEFVRGQMTAEALLLAAVGRAGSGGGGSRVQERVEAST